MPGWFRSRSRARVPPIDPALWRTAYHAGIIQASSVVDRVQEVWKA